MSRLTAIDPATATGETKQILDAVHASLGVTPNLFRVAANSAAALNAMVQLNGALSKGTLRAAAREAIAISVAEANACDYCLSAHTYLGKNAGLSEGQLVAARSARADDPTTQAILTFASAVLRARGLVGTDDLARVRAAGVSDGQIAEIVAHIALNVFTNYLNGVAQTEIDFPVVLHRQAG